MDQNVKFLAWLLFVIANKNPDLYMEWAHWRKNYQFRAQVTECGVEKEPARRVDLKQEVSVAGCLEDDGESCAGNCRFLMALKTGVRLVH